MSMSADILGILFDLLLAAVPLGVFIGLIVSIVKFKKCPKENAGERKGYKTAAIVLGIVLGIMVLAAASLWIFLSIAITHM